MNAQDIKSVTFDKVMRGYRPEEVDAYLAQVAAEMEKLQAEKDDSDKKLFILAEKVDQYRNDEETLKTALLNAQRMGESVIHEARQKAETILYDANSKASQQKEEAADNVAEMENELARLKAEVAKFKSDVLELYRQHIESLSAVPGDDLRAARRAARRGKRDEGEDAQSAETQPAPAAEPAAVPAEAPEGAKASAEAQGDAPFGTEFPEPDDEASRNKEAAFNAYQGIKFQD